MTVAVAAASAVGSRIPKSVTLGALVFMAGAALVYWSLYRSRDGEGLFGLGASAGGTYRLSGPLGTKTPATPGNGLPGQQGSSGTGGGGGALIR